LWPLSREQYPKQLLALAGEDTLLQATARRVDGSLATTSRDVLAPIVVSNEAYRFRAEQIRQVGIAPAAIAVNPGAALSLQMHYHRAEHWVVVRGMARVTRGEETFLLSENESTFIPIGTRRHRLEKPRMVVLEMIEVQSGAYLGEDDTVRFEDTYGRS